MKCRCNLQLDKCMWPGQCESLGHFRIKLPNDYIVTQDREHNVIENYGEYFEGLGELKTKNPWIMPTEKETKMTRDEALNIAKRVGNERPWYESDVMLLEALGLIKFDEEKSVEEVVNHVWYNSNGIVEFVNNLDKHGYKIVKK